MCEEVGGWSFAECSWGEVDDDGRETRYGAWGVRDADWAKQVETGYEALLRPVLEGKFPVRQVGRMVCGIMCFVLCCRMRQATVPSRLCCCESD